MKARVKAVGPFIALTDPVEPIGGTNANRMSGDDLARGTDSASSRSVAQLNYTQ